MLLAAILGLFIGATALGAPSTPDVWRWWASQPHDRRARLLRCERFGRPLTVDAILLHGGVR